MQSYFIFFLILKLSGKITFIEAVMYLYYQWFDQETFWLGHFTGIMMYHSVFLPKTFSLYNEPN